MDILTNQIHRELNIPVELTCPIKSTIFAPSLPPSLYEGSSNMAAMRFTQSYCFSYRVWSAEESGEGGLARKGGN